MDHEMSELIKELLHAAIKLVTNANTALEDAMKRNEELNKS